MKRNLARDRARKGGVKIHRQLELCNAVTLVSQGIKPTSYMADRARKLREIQ